MDLPREKRPRTPDVAVAAAVLLGLCLRIAESLRGLPYLHHWDEPQTAATALRMLQTGDPNPHFFRYGSLLIYLNAGVQRVWGLAHGGVDAVVVDPAFPWAVSHPSLWLWGRLLTVAMGTA